MLTYLADYEHVFGPLRLFRFLTFRMGLAAAMALLIGMAVAPLMMRQLRALKISQSLRDHNEVGKLADLHASKKDTPTMGGLIIWVAVSVSVFLLAAPNLYVWVALLVFTGLTFIGFLDDYLKIMHRNSKGLAGRWKLTAQAVIAVIALTLLLLDSETHAYMRQLWIPFYKYPLMLEMPLWLAFVLFFLVVAGSSNAINITDGVDGLAIGCTVTVVVVYGIMAYAAGNIIFSDYLLISYIPGSGELGVVCAALGGASLAFLWYNSHPATVFMGDTGSLAIGGLVGTIAFMVHQPFTLILVGGIFVMEIGSVMLQVGSFKLTGRRIFRMAPLHHHFELLGWHESKVVIRFWILSLLFAFAGLASLKIR